MRGAGSVVRLVLVAAALAAVPATASAGVLEDARSLMDQGRLARARETLDRAQLAGAGEVQRLLLLTRACNALADYACGVQNGERLVKLAPDSSDAQYALAVALRIKLQQVSKFKAMFIVGDYKDATRRAIELDPHNLDAREEQIGFLANAPGMVGGDRQQARDKIEELRALDEARALRAQSDLEFVEKRDADAVRTLERLLEKDPADAESRFKLAYWLQAHERYAEADAHFAVLVETGGPVDSMNALYQRARTRVLGRFEPQRAVEQLRRFLDGPADLDGVPTRAAALWRLGNAYEQIPDPEEARQAYRKALALDPDVGEARKELEALGG